MVISERSSEAKVWGWLEMGYLDVGVWVGGGVGCVVGSLEKRQTCLEVSREAGHRFVNGLIRKEGKKQFQQCVLSTLEARKIV